MKKVIIALLVLGAFGTSVFAGEWKKDASFNLGYAMPMSDIGDMTEGSMAWGLEYDGYKLNDNVSFGAALFSTKADGKDDAKFAGATMDLSAFEVSAMGFSPFVKYGKEIDLAGKKANLYGTFGLGFYATGIEGPGTDESETDLGFNIGGGIAYPIADKMNLGFDLKYHTVSSKISTEDTSYGYIVPSLKFTYSF